MDSGNTPGCGTAIALIIGLAAILYYGFNMTGFGWILKTAFAIFVLIVVAVIALIAFLIYDALRKEKAMNAEKARKSAEESLRRIQEERAREGSGKGEAANNEIHSDNIIKDTKE